MKNKKINAMEPIRDLDLLYRILQYLKLKNERDYVMFCVGIYTGLRISDILLLKVKDFKNRDYLYIRAKKTGKLNQIPINKELKKVTKEYIADMDPEEYMFGSRKGRKIKPILRGRAYTVLRDIREKFGLDRIATHSMRKTFGYHYYQKYKDVRMLMEFYGHTDQSITLDYIGVNSEMVNTSVKNFSYFK